MLARRFILAAALAALVVAAPPAWATHDLRLFELDGNVKNGSAAGADWSKLFPVDNSTTEIARVFVADKANSPADRSFFTGGGSKDPSLLSAWRHSTGDSAPDKNEITNAFAVAYRSERDTGRNDKGDLILYFGMDRYANNGDAQVGFWFFRDAVGLRSNGTFSGAHRVGDILVVSDFTQGGRVGSIKVYKWVGSGGSDGTLDLLVEAEDCGDVPGDDPVCAVENESSVGTIWPYTPKTGSGSTYAQGSFYEGGINVTRVAGIECFSSFMGETRSSQSIGAQLKDLALGPFDTCPPPPRRISPRPAPRSAARPVRAASGPTLPASGAVPALPGLVGTLFVAVGTAIRVGWTSGPPGRRRR